MQSQLFWGERIESRLRKHLYAFMSICKIKVKYKLGCLCVWVQEKNNKTIYVKKMGGGVFSQSGNSEL